MVVDNGLSLPGRGLAGEDARAQVRGHGQQADGLQVRVQAGVSPAAWAARSWAASKSITVPEFLTRGAIASAGSVSGVAPMVMGTACHDVLKGGIAPRPSARHMTNCG